MFPPNEKLLEINWHYILVLWSKRNGKIRGTTSTEHIEYKKTQLRTELNDTLQTTKICLRRI
jgi:hypothetical protein